MVCMTSKNIMRSIIGSNKVFLYMRNEIDSFLDIMESMLSYDILKHIVQLISTDKNQMIIKKQKQLKLQLNKDIIKLFNTYYYDNNFILYKNDNNQFVLENMSLTNKQIYIYSNKPLHEQENEIVENDQQHQMILHNQSSTNTTNEIVLFEEGSNQELYDDNGFAIQRRIKLNIVYII